MLLQILSHTPHWVFGLFAVLLCLGARQIVPGRVWLARVAAMPVAMVGLSVWGLLAGFGDSPPALLAWAAGAALFGALVLNRPLPAAVRYDPTTRSFAMPGSMVPLLLMMGVFLTKYAVGVALAIHPEIVHRHDVALMLGAVYGAFSGTFAGRALRLWRLAMRSESADTARLSLAD